MMMALGATPGTRSKVPSPSAFGSSSFSPTLPSLAAALSGAPRFPAPRSARPPVHSGGGVSPRSCRLLQRKPYNLQHCLVPSGDDDGRQSRLSTSSSEEA